MNRPSPTPLFDDEDLRPPAGHPERFGARWRLVGAGLSNVWRYGDLVLDAASGRLLLRGPNGTGKTTALEALWPYLLDLNAQRLVAGKARTTTLGSLMREGATGKRRYGYVWLTFAGPGSEGPQTFGVRLQFSAGASPAVKVIPFTVPGVPITDVPLHDAGRAPFTLERFTDLVKLAGGQIFEDEDAYVTHLAARVWGTSAAQLRDLAQRIRAVRNPSLLGEVSPRAAAEALREALPGVAEDIVSATADALAESDATRDAFKKDSEAVDTLDEFAGTWAGHVTAVVTEAHTEASKAEDAVAGAASEARRLANSLERAEQTEEEARAAEQTLLDQLRDTDAQIEILEKDDAYKAAGEIIRLDKLLGVQRKHAAAALNQLTASVTTVRDQTASLMAGIEELTADLDDRISTASNADTTAKLDKPLLTWTSRPQGVVTVGETTADPGPALTVDADPARLTAAADRWTQVARHHTVRAGDAQLAISDFAKTVQPAMDAARKAKKAADEAARHVDAANKAESRATAVARVEADALLDAVVTWPITPDDLYSGQIDDDGGVTMWAGSDIEELRPAEPGQILDEARRWHPLVTERAAKTRASLLERRRGLLDEAKRQATDAAECRTKATNLRAGQLLPLPRPAWLTTSDDTAALAAALDWSPKFDDEHAHALVETALAASGLLSATLTADGAMTSAWQVRPAGPPVPNNLSTVLVVDEAHPLATVAADVLTRIALRPTARDNADNNAVLVIGRDGTFRAGPLFGRAPGADDLNLLPSAQHVGGAQRRAAALARADELDREAAELDEAAQTARMDADQLQRRIVAINQHVKSFPSITALEQGEAARVVAAREATRLRGAAAEARVASIAADEHVAEQRLEWADRTRARSLPVDSEALKHIHENSTAAANTLQQAATAVSGRLCSRLKRLLTDIDRLDRTVATLPTLRSDAQVAHDAAASTDVQVRQLRGNIGQAAQKAREDHTEACAKRDDLRTQTGPARDRVEEAAGGVIRLGERLESAQQAEQAARPTAEIRRVELRTLLETPGVTEVLFDEADATVAADENMLDAVADALTGRRTYGRKTLRERYDSARAALAGMWTLDPADSYGDLDTFVLTHDDMPFTPVAAARRAQELKAKAQAALDAAEESALRDFVVGRLPSAIGTAWTRLHDWVDGVNRKMRSAAASSGVGVQVRARLADDLSPASRTVYELACKTADADRTREQKAAVGHALQQLITAADGETMADKVSAAIDVRVWVEVHYEVTRPGGNIQRWSSKTGLSGGERRLVVLAPMIAAVAAAYDSITPSGLRLTALDEVPAEVDERGREGLARYLAELDLDLVCTSYLWDGAPGAWDGIDAHDLEAAADGTVVAFPMLVRGLHNLPGDPTLEPES